MREVWKDIKGYEELYQVSNLGRVKNIKRNKILKPLKRKGGYVNVNLYNRNLKMKSITIHKIVALTFIANPNNYPCINHKDENKENNNVNNLEWCTAAYNNSYGSRLIRTSKTMKETLNKRPELIKKRPVICITTGEKFDSAKSAAKKYHLFPNNITMVCKGNIYQIKGYRFKYVEVN
ncbi:hypothetical protein FDA09_16805 [Clostridium botulinum]|uniref:NUMOD4 domain-containing protein n=1 Tax=Clostridium botulinum TaxID=1491 RepID=UPI000772F685|nr:NUMOD4 domain-containing protein [Clostridium botulinum]NFH81771.1 hypothetical protein [Clostridium botulinum]NFH85052.1 hypothetical protein [Clostridium botulinum]NFI13006.1 hypothetical protein [Clostridium botulinum]NFI16261.1 hypothetical protein [Clostridium botulinum]NFO86025.1 hypothetical protein [Clostridium botulinum]